MASDVRRSLSNAKRELVHAASLAVPETSGTFAADSARGYAAVGAPAPASDLCFG